MSDDTRNGGSDASSSGSFTDELFSLLDALRALVGAHLALVRAEIVAIARELLSFVVGVIVATSLLITALVALLVALALTLGEVLYGSPLWGAAHLVIGLCAAATGILSSLMRIERGRRGRSLGLAIVVGAAIGAATVGALN